MKWGLLIRNLRVQNVMSLFFYDNNSVKFPCSKIVSFIIFNPDGSSFDFDDKSLLNVKYAE